MWITTVLVVEEPMIDATVIVAFDFRPHTLQLCLVQLGHYDP